MQRPVAPVAPRQNAGVALLLVLFAVAIATVLSVSFLSTQSTTSGISANIQNHSRARDIATSAAMMAAAAIERDPDWRQNLSTGTWIAEQSLHGGTFTVVLDDGYDSDGDGIIEGDGDLTDDTSDLATLTVTGKYHGTTHIIRVEITPGDTLNISRIVVGDKAEIKGDSIIDSFDSSMGAYGGANIGTVAELVTNSIGKEKIKIKDRAVVKGDAYYGVGGNPSQVVRIENNGVLTGERIELERPAFVSPVAVPTHLDPSLGDRVIGGGTTVISSDLHVGKLEIKNNAVVKISGDVTIWAEKDIAIMNSAQLEILPDSKLSLYGGKYKDTKIVISDNAKLNVNTANPGKLIIYHSGTKAMEVKKNAEVYGVIVSPSAELKIKEFGQVFGLFRGKKLTMEHFSRFHMDLSSALIKTGVAFVDTGGGDYGLAADYQVEIKNKAVVKSHAGAPVSVSTNEGTLFGYLKVKDSASVTGDAFCHPQGSPATIIKIEGSGYVSGVTAAAALSVTIPEPDVPEMPATVGNVTYSAGTTTISSDLHVTKLTLKNAAILQISGDVTILVDGDFVMENTSQIQLLPGASLTLYTQAIFLLKDESKINATGTDPTKVQINHLSASDALILSKSSQTVATVVVPVQTFNVKEQATFTGTARAKAILIEGDAIIKVDQGIGDGAYPIGSLMDFRYQD